MSAWSVFLGTLAGNAVFHAAFVGLMKWREAIEIRRRTQCETCAAPGANMIRLSVGSDGMRMIRLCPGCFSEAERLQRENQADG